MPPMMPDQGFQQEPMPPMDGGQEGQMPPYDEGGENGFPPEQDGDFGGGFDAGVEADEDEDPKRFIQQLTGKLSQSLNTYEDKDDEGLYKYVGKMIVKQAAKNLDKKGRKDLIKAINMADSDTDDDGGEDVDMDAQDDMQDAQNDGEMMECTIKKSDFSKALKEEFGINGNSERTAPLNGKKRKNIFNGKPF